MSEKTKSTKKGALSDASTCSVNINKPRPFVEVEKQGRFVTVRWTPDNWSCQKSNKAILELYGKGYEILIIGKLKKGVWVQELYKPQI